MIGNCRNAFLEFSFFGVLKLLKSLGHFLNVSDAVPVHSQAQEQPLVPVFIWEVLTAT